MNVLIVADCNDDGWGVVLIARTETVNMISGRIRIVGTPFGNPYIIFGAICEDFTGRSKFDIHITVAKCTSGDLENWE